MGGIIMGLLDTVREIAGKIFTNGVLATPEVAKKRLKICNACPYLLRTTRNCKKCLCIYYELREIVKNASASWMQK